MPSSTLVATTAGDGGAGEWYVPEPPWGVSNTIYDNAMGSAATTATLSFGGFPAGAIPTNATLTGLVLTGGFWALNASTDYCHDVTLTVGSHATGNLDSASALGTATGGSLVYGTSSTFPTGLAGLSAADINGGSIAATFQFSGPGGGSGMSEIFSSGCSLTVYYTVPATIVKPVVVRAAVVERD